MASPSSLSRGLVDLSPALGGSAWCLHAGGSRVGRQNVSCSVQFARDCGGDVMSLASGELVVMRASSSRRPSIRPALLGATVCAGGRARSEVEWKGTCWCGRWRAWAGGIPGSVQNGAWCRRRYGGLAGI